MHGNTFQTVADRYYGCAMNMSSIQQIVNKAKEILSLVKSTIQQQTCKLLYLCQAIFNKSNDAFVVISHSFHIDLFFSCASLTAHFRK